MIGYYIIVAVLLIYLHPINAESTYISDVEQVKRHLTEEIELSKSLRTNIGKAMADFDNAICDNRLGEEPKQTICNKIMEHMINKETRGAFGSFVEKDSGLPTPQLVNRDAPYKCKKIYVKKFLVKRMYWCRSRRYKTVAGDEGEMYGFFSAGHWDSVERVYAFRPPQWDSDFVNPVGEINDTSFPDFIYAAIQRYVRGH